MRNGLMVCLVAASVSLGAGWAHALPMSVSPAGPYGTAPAPFVTPASGGCGPFRHRGFFGYCRLNLVRPYGPYGGARPFRFYRPFIFIRRPFFRPF